MSKGLGRIKWWFRAPPGVQGQVLLDYLRWPITVVAIVVVLYGATLGIIGSTTHDLTLDLAFSAAQVFTGFAGAGAAVAAIAGIAKQFERPQAKLRLEVQLGRGGGYAFVTIANDGTADAHAVTLTIEPGNYGVEAADVDAWWSMHSPELDAEYQMWTYGTLLPAGGQTQLTLKNLPAGRWQLIADASNARSNSYKHA